jgi:hypothetical protein
LSSDSEFFPGAEQGVLSDPESLFGIPCGTKESELFLLLGNGRFQPKDRLVGMA